MRANVNPYAKDISVRGRLARSALVALLLGVVAAVPARAAFSHAPLDRVLAACVTDGRVHYGKLRGQQAQLDAYLKELAAAKLEYLESAAEIRAFWINAYNACVLRGVLDAFPISRPTDVPGFFDQKRYRIMGQELTLNEMENAQLRKLGDPRLHFALVCGATSCPDLRGRSWDGDTLDADLDAATRVFLSDPSRGAAIDDAGTLHLSEIFRWYGKDFGGPAGVLTFVAKQGPKTIAERAAANPPPPVKYLPYDWTLNAIELKGVRRIKLW